MSPKVLIRTLGVVGAIGLTASSIPFSAQAEPTFFSDRCASCHTDDEPSCVGCHFHNGSITASANQTAYNPGEIVTITLTGGSRGGWVRGLLYDQNGTEIFRATGPTGTGDDGLGNPVTFPVTLQAPAPTTPGQYTWEAAWFGGATNGGGAHLEESDTVTFTVEASSPVPDEGQPAMAWDSIKALYR